MQKDLNRSRGVEKGVELGVEDLAVNRYSCRASVEVQKHQTQEMRLDRSTRCREAIEGTETFLIDPLGVEIAIRKSLEARQIARCRGGVELAFKISFSRREKHRHECNQVCNSINDPNTILTSQNHLSTAILSTWIPKKKHTHTE